MDTSSPTLRTICMVHSSRMDKLRCIHTMKYYTAIKNKQITEILNNKNEPNVLLLSERSRSFKTREKKKKNIVM